MGTARLGARQPRGLDGTGHGRALPPACHPPGGGLGQTSASCRDRTGGPDASQRAGQAPEPRGSDARGGDGPRAHSPSRGGTAQRGLGHAGGAAYPLSGPGPRRCEPATAGPRADALPHHPHRPAGRHHRRSSPTVRLADFGHQCPATTAAAVVCSRHAYRVERVCNRLQGRRQIAPRCVKRTDHIAGLTSLLTLGVRGVTVTAFVLRRSLEQEQTSLPGLPPEHKRKRTDTPTAERLLPAFSGVSLTIIQSAAGEDILRRIPPLAGVQEALLHRLGLGTHLYRQLARAKVSPKPWDWRSLHEIGWCFPVGAHLQGASPP